MNYTEAKRFIDGLSARGISPGLGSISALCAALGDPQDKIKTIHIAGTNGKGSAGAFLESILMSSGADVCRFSSPAVADHLEMFTFNGSPVSGADYAECVEKLVPAIRSLEKKNIYVTSFEAETAAAFLLFEKLKPDYALIECGMGGRLDSTNIIASPALSVIASVSLDHTAFLGGDLKSIAREKAGIIKPGCPAVTAIQPEEAADVIRSAAEAAGSELFTADRPVNERFTENGTVFDLGDTKDLSIRLKGTYQPRNAAIAVKAAAVLGIAENAVRQGLESARWPFRFERIGKYILDGAHNPDAAEALVSSAKIYLKGRTALICGCFKDKDHDRIAAVTAPIASHVYTVRPAGPRGLDSALLAREFRSHEAEVTDSGSLREAISAASSRDHDNILIFGSLSILNDAKKIIQEQKGKDR